MFEYNREKQPRTYQRLKLQLPAEMITLDGPEEVLLLDLSQVGARMICRSRPAFSKGVLCWIGFETYGEKVWQKDRMCGLRFDEELDLGVVVQTRCDVREEWKRHTDDIAAAARLWAQGR